MDSFKDKFSARFQNLMRVFEYHLGALYYWHFSVFPLLLQIVLKLSRYTNITPLLKEIEYPWSFKSSRLGLISRHIRKLHLQWKYWQNLKGMHHIRQKISMSHSPYRKQNIATYISRASKISRRKNYTYTSKR